MISSSEKRIMPANTQPQQLLMPTRSWEMHEFTLTKREIVDALTAVTTDPKSIDLKNFYPVVDVRDEIIEWRSCVTYENAIVSYIVDHCRLRLRDPKFVSYSITGINDEDEYDNAIWHVKISATM